MRRSGIALLAALLLLSLGFSSTITGQVTNADKVRLSGTVIEVVRNGAIVATATTDDIGNYKLELDNGVYFFRFLRSGYQLKVILFEVKNTSSGNNFILSMTYPTATIYGIASGAPLAPGFKVSLYKGSTFVRSVSALPGGEYYIPDVYPGEYTIKATPGDYDAVEERVSVSAGDVLMQDVVLKPRVYETNDSAPGETALYSLEVPGQVNVGSEIVATVVSNTGSACNKTVIVTAPNAAPYDFTTQCDGKIPIIAAEPGTYVFEFEGVRKECIVSAAAANNTPGMQFGTVGQPATPAQVPRLLGFSIFELALFGGIVLAVAATSLAALYLVTRKETHAPGQGKPEEQAEKPSEPAQAKPRKQRKQRKKSAA